MNAFKNNIKFNYLYRDGGNFKVWGFEIFSNPDSIELNSIEERIKHSLIDGEFFDPKNWSVSRLKFDDWVPELDHTWNEYDSIEITTEEPTIHYSIKDFLEVIAKAPKYKESLSSNSQFANHESRISTLNLITFLCEYLVPSWLISSHFLATKTQNHKEKNTV